MRADGGAGEEARNGGQGVRDAEVGGQGDGARVLVEAQPIEIGARKRIGRPRNGQAVPAAGKEARCWRAASKGGAAARSGK